MLRRLKEAASHRDFNAPSNVADTLSGVTKKISEKGGSVAKQAFDPEVLKRLRSQFGEAIGKVKKPTLGGLALAGATAFGLPENSMASDVVDVADPTSRALNAIKVGDVGEGSDIITPEMQSEMSADQERRKAQIQALRSLPQQDFVTQRQAPAMTGEQPIPEQDELGPIQSQPETNRFSRVFKDKGTFR